MAATLRQESNARWERANRDLRLARQRAWRAANPERHAEQTLKAKLKHYFGITPADYAAMLTRQAGRCAICRLAESTIDRSGRVRRLGVDHDHVTGRVRGLLCNPCNRALGYLQDDPERLMSAVAYLRDAYSTEV